MEKKNGLWTIESSSEIYGNDFLRVKEDRVITPDGKTGSYATVKMNDGVCILPVDENGELILTKQFRYALGRESIEAVAGSVDKDEDSRSAAHRELKEELGIIAGDLLSLGKVDLDTSIIQCRVQLFLARKLRFTYSEQEAAESIKPYRISFKEALHELYQSRITHAPTCIIILKARQFLKMA